MTKGRNQIQNPKSPIQNPKTERVGWTAFYTAAVWAELGVPGAKRFVTRRGLFLRELARWGGGSLGLAGQYSVTNLFLASRHLGLDRLLEQHQPTQIVELAAGFSARGREFTRHYPCRYIELDQPGVVEVKKAMLASDERPAAPGAIHTLLTADLRHLPGPTLAQFLAPHLDPTRPTLIIAEGLTGYLNEESLRGLLSSLHVLAAQLAEATLLVDFYLRLERPQHGRVALAMLPPQLIWRLLRAPMQMFLRDEQHIRALLTSEGFEIEQLYSCLDLAKLAGRPNPPLNLFYIGELKVAR